MTPIEAAGLWAGLHVLLMLFLKLRAGATRARTKVNFGDGGNEDMQRALRVQGNAVEDVPIALIGIGALAYMAAPIMLIHGLGGVLLVSRVLHALGLGGSSGFSIGRFAGTIGSLVVLLATGGACLYFALQ